MKPEPDESRLINLESAVSHLQHDLEQLNEAVLRQDQELTLLKQLAQRLESRLGELADSEIEHDPEADRPPHY